MGNKEHLLRLKIPEHLVLLLQLIHLFPKVRTVCLNRDCQFGNGCGLCFLITCKLKLLSDAILNYLLGANCAIGFAVTSDPLEGVVECCHFFVSFQSEEREVQKRPKINQPEESLFKSMVESSPPVLQRSHLLTVASHLDSKLAGLKLTVPRMARSKSEYSLPLDGCSNMMYTGNPTLFRAGGSTMCPP